MEIKKVNKEDQEKKLPETELQPMKDKDMSTVSGGRGKPIHVCG